MSKRGPGFVGRYNCGFGRAPRKGSNLRQLVLMAMRPQGVTVWEAEQSGACPPHLFSNRLIQLLNEKGYDIRSFPMERTVERVGPKQMRSKKPPRVWRLVGKIRWDGTYRDLVKVLDVPDASR